MPDREPVRPDWPRECDDLNSGLEVFCYRCGAGPPEDERKEWLEALRRIAHGEFGHAAAFFAREVLGKRLTDAGAVRDA